MWDRYDDHCWVFRAPGWEERVIRVPKDTAREVVTRIRDAGYTTHPWQAYLVDTGVALPDIERLAHAAGVAYRVRRWELERATESEVSSSLENEWVRRYAEARVAKDPVAQALRGIEEYGSEALGQPGATATFDM